MKDATVSFLIAFIVIRLGAGVINSESEQGVTGGKEAKALASHQCGPGSNPGSGFISKSCFWVLVLAQFQEFSS